MHPPPSAPSSLPLRTICMGYFSRLSYPLVPVFSSGEPWQDIRGGGLHSYSPVWSLQAAWTLLEGHNSCQDGPSYDSLLGSVLLPLSQCQGPHTSLPFSTALSSLGVSLHLACLLQIIPLLNSPQIIQFKDVDSVLLRLQLL